MLVVSVTVMALFGMIAALLMVWGLVVELANMIHCLHYCSSLSCLSCPTEQKLLGSATSVVQR